MDQPMITQSIQRAVKLLKKANIAVALTGAGSSTPSGIPDFRTKGSGLWTRYSPEKVATLTAFRQNPVRFYKWFRPLAYQLLTAKPNPAHFALAQLERKNYLNTLITQNIDGLHQKAGAINVLQVHGTLDTLSCIGCFRQVNAEDFTVIYIKEGNIPYCETCGKVLKPDIVLFGEQLPAQVWAKAQRAVLACDLLIVAGTSLIVSPVAQLPEQALKNGARIIIVNKSSTYLDKYADVVIHEDIANILPEITMNTIR
jgi:NAD-dependent deacetylase